MAKLGPFFISFNVFFHWDPNSNCFSKLLVLGSKFPKFQKIVSDWTGRAGFRISQDFQISQISKFVKISSWAAGGRSAGMLLAAISDSPFFKGRPTFRMPFDWGWHRHQNRAGGGGSITLFFYFVLCSPNHQSPISQNKIKSERPEIGWGGRPPPEDQRTAYFTYCTYLLTYFTYLLWFIWLCAHMIIWP